MADRDTEGPAGESELSEEARRRGALLFPFPESDWPEYSEALGRVILAMLMGQSNPFRIIEDVAQVADVRKEKTGRILYDLALRGWLRRQMNGFVISYRFTERGRMTAHAYVKKTNRRSSGGAS